MGSTAQCGVKVDGWRDHDKWILWCCTLMGYLVPSKYVSFQCLSKHSADMRECLPTCVLSRWIVIILHWRPSGLQLSFSKFCFTGLEDCLRCIFYWWIIQQHPATTSMSFGAIQFYPIVTTWLSALPSVSHFLLWPPNNAHLFNTHHPTHVAYEYIISAKATTSHRWCHQHLFNRLMRFVIGNPFKKHLPTWFSSYGWVISALGTMSTFSVSTRYPFIWWFSLSAIPLIGTLKRMLLMDGSYQQQAPTYMFSTSSAWFNRMYLIFPSSQRTHNRVHSWFGLKMSMFQERCYRGKALR